MRDDEKIAAYMRRVNSTPSLSYDVGRAVGWHLSWLVTAAVLVGGVLLLLHCGTAHAQAFECADDGEAHAAPRRATLTHDGEAGTWFRRDVARCLLGYVGELRERRHQYSLLQERLTIRDDQLALVREAVELSRAAEERATGALEAAARRAREAEADRDAWWRSPVLWLVVGVVVTIGLEVVAVAVLGAV